MDPLDFLRTDPHDTVVLLDIDGTLCPIVDDPADACLDEAMLEAVTDLAARSALLGCITGRSLADARAMVPVDGIFLAAAHGMHIVDEDGNEDICAVAVAARPQLQLATTMAQTVGWRFEDKVHSVTLHFRHVATPDLTARQMRAQIATVLDPSTIEVCDARLALELRPVGARTKADAVAAALARVPGARRVLYAGDDRTDVDAFRALADSGLDSLRVAIASDEAPAELLDEADVVLDGVPELADLLGNAARQAM